MTALITDSHFYNNFSFGTYDAKGISTRLYEISKIHLDFVNHCIQAGVKTILHGGDLLHRSQPSVIEVLIAGLWIEKAIENGISVYLMNGNHEYNYLNSALNLFGFKFISNHLHVVSEITMKEFNDIPFLMIPFVKPSEIDVDKLYKQMAGLPQEAVIAGHCSVDTAIPGVEQTFLEKDPIVLKSSKLKELKTKNVLFGHVHDRQRFFLGASICISYKDRNPQKCYWLDGDYYEIEQSKFHTINVDMETEDVQDKIELEIGKIKYSGFVRVLVTNSPPYYELNKKDIRKMMPEYLKLVDARTEKKNVVKAKSEDAVGEELRLPSIKEVLVDYQKEVGYHDDSQGNFERMVMESFLRS